MGSMVSLLRRMNLQEVIEIWGLLEARILRKQCLELQHAFRIYVKGSGYS